MVTFARIMFAKCIINSRSSSPSRGSTSRGFDDEPEITVTQCPVAYYQCSALWKNTLCFLKFRKESTSSSGTAEVPSVNFVELLEELSEKQNYKHTFSNRILANTATGMGVSGISTRNMASSFGTAEVPAVNFVEEVELVATVGRVVLYEERAVFLSDVFQQTIL